MINNFNIVEPLKAIRLLLFVLSGLILLGGCRWINSGIFLDSPVQGLTFSTSFSKGTTDENGTFFYGNNETVSFSVGGVLLGSAPGAEQITPVDLVDGGTTGHQAVINMASFLQTLDADGDNNNGIRITAAIREVIASKERDIHFDQPSDAFAADPNVTGLLAELNASDVFTDLDPRDRALKPAAQAQEHLAASLSDRVIAKTRYGDLKGFGPNEDTWQWRAIPYAKPPVGDLRWRPPQPPAGWKGARDAVAWSDQAAQNPYYEQFGLGGMSEDCLYLNVTAPREADKLPVMVWFHGGGFRILTGNAASFNNAASLPTRDVVLVTVNHRLGPFGYLAHPDLSAESKHGVSGNYGQLDLIAALKWVRHNIACFGGDPDNVTIFGESGGGGKVLSLLTSPLAAGLFHKAICESGQAAPDDQVINPSGSLAAAEAKGEEIAALLGVDGEMDVPAAMRAMNWVDIVTVLDEAGVEYSPNVDHTYYQPDTMENTFAAGKQNDVPFMAGANTGDMPGLIEGFLYQMPWIAANHTSDVFSYVFSQVPAGWNAQGVLAYHGIELVYVFNYPASFITHFYLGLTGLADESADMNGDGIVTPNEIMASSGYGAADHMVTDTVMTMWANFAHTGNPSIPGVIDWPAYTGAVDDGGNDTYLLINSAPSVETGISEAFPSPSAPSEE